MWCRQGGTFGSLESLKLGSTIRLQSFRDLLVIRRKWDCLIYQINMLVCTWLPLGGQNQSLPQKIKNLICSLLQTVWHCMLKGQDGFQRPITPPSGLGTWNMPANDSLLMPLLKARAVGSELQEQWCEIGHPSSRDCVPKGRRLTPGWIQHPPWPSLA